MWWFVLTFIGGLAVGGRKMVPAALVRRTHWIVSLCLLFLVFLLGEELGSNRALVRSLPLLGYRAVVIAVFAMAGSVLFATLTARWLWRDADQKTDAPTPLPLGDRRGRMHKPTSINANATKPQRGRSLISHLPGLILVMMVAGGFTGWWSAGSFHIHPSLQNAVFAVMLLGIGVEIGADPRFWMQMQRASWRMFLFPVNAVIGSLIGGLAATLLVQGHLLDNLAAAAGLGWYSLAAVLVNQLSGPEAGTVAFLANVLREMLGFLAIPILNRFMMTPGAVALGAATTMDTTLPLFRRPEDASTIGVVYAFVNGVLVSALVPILIPLVLKL